MMTRIIEVLVILVLILFIISIVVLPWPANIIIGSMAFLSFIITFIYARQVKKKEQDTQQDDENRR